ncbi:MAG: hypothetical protein J5912_01325 [Clostridia bacterium]|nr:hypothetical protein [Clostridia bacterium]
MKTAKKLLLPLLALIILLTAGCAPKYSEWTSGRKAGAEVVETSKQIEDYTLMEGDAEEFTLPAFFADDMIVPRDRRINIWGTAPESQNGKIVAAEFKGLKGSGVIENGEFCFYLQGTLPAGKEKGNSLVVTGGSGVRYEFRNVIVGDIWIVSGQSNADLTFYGSEKHTKDIKALYGEYLDGATEEDDIRILHQINWKLLSKSNIVRTYEPQKNVMKNTSWQLATRKKVYGTSNMSSFSMLGYFFAKELYTLNPEVPVGIIMAACGGAPLALLASPEAVEKFPASLKERTLTLNDFEIPTSGIYNAFMAPYLNLGITGMIFYQGESDALLSAEYGDALKTTVEDYRVKFGSDLLFLNVQLTSYGFESGGEDLVGVWDAVPEMRYAQAEVKIDGSIGNYEIIPTIDVGFRKGDADGAHPYYKLDIGKRGAQIAASLVYGIGDIENTGFPVPSKITYNKEEIVIEYAYAGGGLKTLNDKFLEGFEVKKNGQWEYAEGVIDGNKITISMADTEGVRYASYLRYMSMDAANLCSGTGNPAVPFSVEFN